MHTQPRILTNASAMFRSSVRCPSDLTCEMVGIAALTLPYDIGIKCYDANLSVARTSASTFSGS